MPRCQSTKMPRRKVKVLFPFNIAYFQQSLEVKKKERFSFIVVVLVGAIHQHDKWWLGEIRKIDHRINEIVEYNCNIKNPSMCTLTPLSGKHSPFRNVSFDKNLITHISHSWVFRVSDPAFVCNFKSAALSLSHYLFRRHGKKVCQCYLWILI